MTQKKFKEKRRNQTTNSYQIRKIKQCEIKEKKIENVKKKKMEREIPKPLYFFNWSSTGNGMRSKKKKRLNRNGE